MKFTEHFLLLPVLPGFHAASLFVTAAARLFRLAAVFPLFIRPSPAIPHAAVRRYQQV